MTFYAVGKYTDRAVISSWMKFPPIHFLSLLPNTGRARQAARYKGAAAERGIRTNAEADGPLLDDVAAPEPAGRALLTRAAERLRLSARGYHRVLRVARTLADLEGAATVARRHVAEALSYRRMTTLPAGAS